MLHVQFFLFFEELIANSMGLGRNKYDFILIPLESRGRCVTSVPPSCF